MTTFEKKLPSQIILIPNPDKKDHESWYAGRMIADIPHPFRWILSAPPHSGKSLFVKNVILRIQEGQTPFERIWLVHGSAGHTKEYEDLKIEQEFEQIPRPEDFVAIQEQAKKKSLLIIDDYEFEGLPKSQKKNLSSFFRFVSSHYGWSVFLSFQSFFDIPPIPRKTANLFSIWRPRSKHELPIYASRMNLDKDILLQLCEEHLKERYDNLTFDFTINSPFPVRKNLFTVVD